MTGFTNVGRRPNRTALQTAMTQYDREVTAHNRDSSNPVPVYSAILQTTVPAEHRPGTGSIFSEAALTWAEDERVRALEEKKKKRKKEKNKRNKLNRASKKKKDHDGGGGGGEGIPIPAR